MSLRVKVDKFSEHSAKTHIDFSLKTPTKSGRYTMNSSHFVSTLVLHIGEPKAVSVIDYRNAVRAEYFPHIMQRLPILGPLFRGGRDETAQNKIIIWFLLNHDEVGEETTTNREMMERFASPLGEFE